MDRAHFDNLTRLVWTRQSRRAVMAALLGAVLLGHAPAPTSAKLLAKRKRNGKKTKGNRPCYPGNDCIPGQGKDNAGCDFSRSGRFRDRDVHGSQLSGANFTSADLRGANLQGADLGGACLTDAVLYGATIDASTSLKDAIFCNTVMPDGSRNDSGCGQGTRCCPTTCDGVACAEQTCISTPGQICSFFGTPCCEYQSPAGWKSGQCTPVASAPFLTFCQWSCDSDSDCTDFFGTGASCVFDLFFCTPYVGGKCCQFRD